MGGDLNVDASVDTNEDDDEDEVFPEISDFKVGVVFEGAIYCKFV